MRTPLLLPFTPLLLPLTLASPPTPPYLTRLTTSGTGCPSSNPSSLTPSSSTLSDAFNLSFTQLKGANTDNCAVHVESSGGSAGWQVAVREVAYTGDVVLRGSSGLDVFTQVFWSEGAGDTAVLTGSLVCTGPEIRQSVTVRSTTADLKWSKCTASDGNPGILNVNFRPVVQGEFGSYDFKRASWGLEWRRC